MQKLWLRISYTFFTLLVITMLAVFFFLATTMKSTYLNMTREQLTQNAQLMAGVLDVDNLAAESSEIQSEVIRLFSAMEQRITVIDLTGTVIADSEDDPTQMENHATRPEIKAVLNQNSNMGESIRPSETLGYDMMYVAIPIVIEDNVVGAIRASVMLDVIEETTNKLWMQIALAMIVILVLAGLISMRLAKGITRPIEEIIEVSSDLTQKNYKSRARMTTTGEINQLAQAINQLAASLQIQMEELHENEQRLSGVLSNMVSGVLLVNEDAEIVLVNRAMENILGAKAAALIGRNHFEVSNNFGLSQLIEQALAMEKVEFKKELQLYSPREQTLDAHVASYLDENGDVKGVIVVLHDITDIRRLEKMRSEFVANVSHEIRTPITAVKGFAETLLDGDLKDEETTRKFLEIISDESNRLHRLISDLLHLSRIEQQGLRENRTEVEIIDAIKRTVATVQTKLTNKKLTVKLPVQKSVVIKADNDSIQQILLNLLSNAILHTASGGAIAIEVKEEAPYIQLLVQDTGTGIPEKDLSRIFERFYRVDKARARDSGGTGLGLSIVKHLVESHQGTITVESVEGEGTTFTITLPIN